jgi:uncharacterized hydrophobic protein (TIGR00271 family)
VTEPLDSITNNIELEDGTEETQFSLAPIDTKLLTSPTVLRSVVAIVVGLALLAWPNVTDRIVSRLIAAALVWLALDALRSWWSSESRDLLSVLLSLATLIGGVFLLLSPDRSALFLGRLIGQIIVGYALYSTYKTLRSRRDTEREEGDQGSGHLSLYGLFAAMGFALIVATEGVMGVFLAAGAIAAIAVSLLMLGISLDARTEGEATYDDTANVVLTWLNDRPKSADARQTLYDKILYEGATTQTRIFRFFVLMGLSAAIASMGVITDSTAVVIGAMLVAPLMTPLMGMAISLMMGWPNRLRRSTVVALGGIVFAIGIGVLFGFVAPAVIDTATNGQIIARTSPTVLDLITAIAAGAAGAYALSRPDVSDSLSGVAIAISLVPPLTVVGIAYSQADWSAGNGALLLFATNMITILLVGGVTFILTGIIPIQRAADNQYRVRTATYTTVAAAVLIIGSLLINGAEVAINTFQQSTVESEIDSWLSEASTHRLVSAQLDGDVVNVVVIGPSDGLPELQTLADRLTDELDKTITVNVGLVVEERLSASGGG